MTKFHPHYPALTEQKDQQDRDEDIPSPPLHPSLNAVETADLSDEEPQQVLEVTDCSPEFELFREPVPNRLGNLFPPLRLNEVNYR